MGESASIRAAPSSRRRSGGLTWVDPTQVTKRGPHPMIHVDVLYALALLGRYLAPALLDAVLPLLSVMFSFGQTLRLCEKASRS